MIERFGTPNELTGEIIRGRSFTQPFIAQEELLAAVGVEFATYRRTNKCSITAEIVHKGSRVGSVSINAADLVDNRVHNFKFGLKVKIGDLYELNIFSLDGRFGNSVTIKWGTPIHENLFMKRSGAVSRGEIYCVLYYGDAKVDYGKIPKMVNNTPSKIADRTINRFNLQKHPTLSIIIPTAKRLDHLKTCLDSLAAHTEDYEVVVVVNSPDTGFSTQVQKLVGLYTNHLYIRIPQYAGYVIPCNMGAAICRGKNLCILNDDTVARRGWTDGMLAALKADKKLAQVGPSLAHMDKNFAFVPIKTDYPYLEGWCFIVPRHVYEAVGLFDPGIDFAYCEDSDFSTMVISKGYTIKEVKSSIIHIGTQTSKSTGAMQVLTDGCETRNKDYLRKKWGKKK